MSHVIVVCWLAMADSIQLKIFMLIMLIMLIIRLVSITVR